MILIEDLQALIPDAAETDLDVLREMERAAVAFVETQTGRYFGPRIEHEEIVIGKGTNRLWLLDIAADADLTDPYFDAQIVVEERQYAGGDATLVTDYDTRVVRGEAYLVRHAGCFWTKGYEYVVTYMKGYEQGEEPADIRKVVIALVRNAWTIHENGGLRSETLGGYSYAFGAADLFDLVDTDRATLDAWRRQIVA